MAYIDINWNYGDDTVISGFKIFRNDIELAEVANTDRSFQDSLVTLTGREVTYSVKAFDANGVLAQNTSFATVKLDYPVTPIMTSQNTPGGNCYSVQTSPRIDYVSNGYIAYDGTDNDFYLSTIDGTNPTAHDFYVDVRYQFPTGTRVSTFGLKTCNYLDTLALLTDSSVLPFTLYGTNDIADEASFVEIASNTIPTNVTSGTQFFFDVPADYYTGYVIRFNLHMYNAGYNGYKNRPLFKELYLNDSPYI